MGNFSYLDNIVRCANDALEKPQDFAHYGKEEMFKTWGFCGIDKHRDSRVLEISNFEIITKDLMTKYPDDFIIEGYAHWAVGHIDRLCVKVLNNQEDGVNESNISEAFKAALQWHEDLLDYHIADENHYMNMIDEENINFIKNYLPTDIENMINTSVDNWAEELYSKINYIGCELDSDADIYPKDNEFLECVFLANLCNKEKLEEWNEWCSENGFDFQKIVESTNQLKLFN